MKASIVCLFIACVGAGCAVPGVVEGDKPGGSSDDRNDEGDGSENKSDDLTATPEVDEKKKDAPTPAADLSFTGTLEKTPPHYFGHRSPNNRYCYALQFTTLEVKAVADAEGRLRSMTVTGLMNETQNDPACNVTPKLPSRHSYSFTTKTPSEGPVSLKPAATNSPQAELIAEVSTASSQVTLRWHRTDVQAPWDWELTTQVTLKPSAPPRDGAGG